MGQVLDFMFKLDVAMTGGFPGQVSKAAQSLQKLQDQTQALQQASGKITAYQKQQDAITKSTSKLESLREKLTAQQSVITSARESVSSLSQQYKSAQKNLSAMSKTEDKDSAAYLKAQQEVAKLGEQFNKAKGELKQFEQVEGELSSKVKEAEESLSGQKQKLSDMESGLKSAGIDTKNLASEQERLSAVIKRSHDAMTRYNSLRSKLSWGNLKSEFMNIYAAVKPLQAPVKLAMDFESAIARVQAVGFTDGKGLEGLERMKEQALELGAATKFTAVEAARAQENLIRAGMTPQQTMSAMTGTLNMAAAEGMSIDEASAIIAKGLGGMNLEAKYAPRYADVLAYTSSKSNTDIRTISEAMRIAAPTAAGQNIQLEQLASYIGALANKGYEGADVGTALASSISRLARRPKQAADALRELGVSVMTKSGGLVQLPVIMKQLDEKMKGMGELQKQGYLSRIFGGNYDKIMLAFMSAVTSGDQEKLQAGEYTESFGWSKKQADINLNTLAGQLDILQSSWDGLRIAVGDIFSPAVRRGVEFLSEGLSRINKIIKDYPRIMKPLIWLGTGVLFTKTLSGIGSIASAIIQLPFAKLALWNAQKAALSALPGGLGALSAGANGLANGMSSAAKGASLFGMSISSALGTLSLIVTATLLIADNWKEITQWAENAGRAITSIDTGKISAAKAGTLSRDDPDYGVSVMNMTYAPAGIPQHAKGGIMTHPHIGLVAEKGPEAIIPLRDKSRGLSVLNTAMNILGVTSPVSNNSQSQLSTVNRISQSQNSVSRITDSISQQKFPAAGTNSQQNFSSNAADFTDKISAQRRIYDNGRYINDSSISSVDNSGNTQHIAPVINITLNSQGDNGMSIAQRIKQAVIEAMNELSSREERVSFA